MCCFRLSQLLRHSLRRTRFADVAWMAVVGVVLDILSPVAVAVNNEVVVGLVLVMKVTNIESLPGSSQTPG